MLAFVLPSFVFLVCGFFRFPFLLLPVELDCRLKQGYNSPPGLSGSSCLSSSSGGHYFVFYFTFSPFLSTWVLIPAFFCFALYNQAKPLTPRAGHSTFDPTPCVAVFQSRVNEWVTMDMWPLESEVEMTAPCFDFGFVQSICSGKIVPDITTLRFRNPDVFIAGQLHLHSEVWEKIASLSTYDRADEVLDWIKNKVSLFKFFRPFKGHFKGRAYDSVIPPRIEFDNNKSCNNFVDFIVNTLLERVCSGAISVLGRVGEVDPPHLVMPLTVEPTKPRLCHDNRFLNLWMVDRPFRLDNLSQLPRYLTKGCYQTTLDDKSGYDHILLDVSSRTFFGIRWRGWYFVSNTIPFGWKISAYVYHSTGLLVSHFCVQ